MGSGRVSTSLTTRAPLLQTVLENNTTIPLAVRDDELASKRAKAGRVSWHHKRRTALDISPRVRELKHPARNFLDRLRKHGVPVGFTTKSWSLDRKDEAVKRGPHQSAKLESEFVREEFVDFLNKGFWTTLPYRLVRHMRSLRLSPLGVVPQCDCRPRLIVDLTFHGVNQEYLPVSPNESMQFGRALQWILQRILLADPSLGPVYISKIDISDGFYRIHLAPRDAIKLGVLLPQVDGEEPMIAIPLVLPMGWVQSPPYFSSATETAADLMNWKLCEQSNNLPKHRLEDLALQQPHQQPAESGANIKRPKVPTTSVPDQTIHPPQYRKPMRYADVYIDDFLGLCQGNEIERHLAMCTLLPVLDDVFRPLEPTDGPFRQEPASIKKLRKGDATWSTKKVVLGWLLDTVAQTIQLPPHRVDRLNEILASVRPDQHRTTARAWHKLLGELRSMTMAIPGARGLFSTLQTAFATADDPLSHSGNRRLRLTKAVHTFLDDFRTLAHDLGNRPTRIAELIPRQPSVLGAIDASGFGMGGVAFVHTDLEPVAVVWREEVPGSIQRRLVSFQNLTGDVTNSDLELAATVLHHDVLTLSFDLREHTISTFHDNTPAQYWQRKGSTTTMGPAASLLRLQSHHQRQHRYVPLHNFLSGDLNRMGDDASRLFELSHVELLSHFNTTYPQRRPWQLYHVRPSWTSTVISALAKTPSAVASLEAFKPVLTGTGASGSSSVMTSTSIPSCNVAVIPFPSFKSSRHGTAVDLVPPDSPSSLAQFQTRLDRWAP